MKFLTTSLSTFAFTSDVLKMSNNNHQNLQEGVHHRETCLNAETFNIIEQNVTREYFQSTQRSFYRYIFNEILGVLPKLQNYVKDLYIGSP